MGGEERGGGSLAAANGGGDPSRAHLAAENVLHQLLQLRRERRRRLGHDAPLRPQLGARRHERVGQRLETPHDGIGLFIHLI